MVFWLVDLISTLSNTIGALSACIYKDGPIRDVLKEGLGLCIRLFEFEEDIEDMPSYRSSSRQM